jgi:phage terminase large subunit-like protein
MKWDFRKIRAEITAAQDVIVKELKNNYVRRYGLALVVEDFRPTRYMGSKEERVDSILQPKYENGQVWHYMGGNCQTLEEELKLRKPPHDDCKDALASAIDSAIAPTFATHMNNKTIRDPVYHSRFGGII